MYGIANSNNVWLDLHSQKKIRNPSFRSNKRFSESLHRENATRLFSCQKDFFGLHNVPQAFLTPIRVSFKWKLMEWAKWERSLDPCPPLTWLREMSEAVGAQRGGQFVQDLNTIHKIMKERGDALLSSADSIPPQVHKIFLETSIDTPTRLMFGIYTLNTGLSRHINKRGLVNLPVITASKFLEMPKKLRESPLFEHLNQNEIALLNEIGHDQQNGVIGSHSDRSGVNLIEHPTKKSDELRDELNEIFL